VYCTYIYMYNKPVILIFVLSWHFLVAFVRIVFAERTAALCFGLKTRRTRLLTLRNRDKLKFIFSTISNAIKIFRVAFLKIFKKLRHPVVVALNLQYRFKWEFFTAKLFIWQSQSENGVSFTYLWWRSLFLLLTLRVLDLKLWSFDVERTILYSELLFSCLLYGLDFGRARQSRLRPYIVRYEFCEGKPN